MDRLAVLLLGFLLAGCADPASVAEPPSETQAPPQRFLLSQCTSFVGEHYLFPGPSQAPQGWEPRDPLKPGWVFVSGYECNRIHLGPYERGPVRIVWDGHTNADFPPACVEGMKHPTARLLLNVILVDDAEIAAYLSDAYGLPTFHSPIGIAGQSANAPRQLTWTWGNGTKSQLNFVDDGTAGEGPRDERLFWEKDGGIAALDLAHDGKGSAVADRFGYGQMGSPMLLADVAGGVFSGTVRHSFGIETEANVRFYRDLGCEDEVDPAG